MQRDGEGATHTTYPSNKALLLCTLSPWIRESGGRAIFALQIPENRDPRQRVRSEMMTTAVLVGFSYQTSLVSAVEPTRQETRLATPALALRHFRHRPVVARGLGAQGR
jgi:hypothetical protein